MWRWGAYGGLLQTYVAAPLTEPVAEEGHSGQADSVTGKQCRELAGAPDDSLTHTDVAEEGRKIVEKFSGGHGEGSKRREAEDFNQSGAACSQTEGGVAGVAEEDMDNEAHCGCVSVSDSQSHTVEICGFLDETFGKSVTEHFLGAENLSKVW